MELSVWVPVATRVNTPWSQTPRRNISSGSIPTLRKWRVYSRGLSGVMTMIERESWRGPWSLVDGNGSASKRGSDLVVIVTDNVYGKASSLNMSEFTHNSGVLWYTITWEINFV